MFDFKFYFLDRACNLSSSTDYKMWSPADIPDGQRCLLGRKDIYKRRDPKSNCYNGIDFDSPTEFRNCECQREDYEWYKNVLFFVF